MLFELAIYGGKFMKTTRARKNRILSFVIIGILATAAPALADKPSWAGGGKKSEKYEQKGKEGRHDDSQHGRDDHREYDGKGMSTGVNVYFGDRHRTAVHEYYRERYRSSGHCPPGLAKKNNGCMPPGQAKKWAMGRPLPREVIYYDVEPEILVRLGPPPEHHRFVRVASDILMIAVGTGMVVDAIADLGEIR